jgi:hypothetical protein
MTRYFPSIDPSSMTIFLTAILEMDNILENVVDETEGLLGRGQSFSSWLTLFLAP